MGLANQVAVIGAGTIRFGESFHRSYTDMVYEAASLVTADAGVEPQELQVGSLGTYEPFLYGYEGNAGTFVGDTLDLPPIPITRLAAYCASAMEVRMINSIADQLLGRAGRMQVPGAGTGLAHTLGGPSAVSCVAVLGQP